MNDEDRSARFRWKDGDVTVTPAKKMKTPKINSISKCSVEYSDQKIRSALDEIGDTFEENELAYLAVTSKIEHPFRDRLSFLLHKRYEAEGYLVAREWKRIDMAILNHEGEPLILIELKAMYTFDAIDRAEHYSKLMAKMI